MSARTAERDWRMQWQRAASCKEKTERRAEAVHHIVELKEHPELGLEDDNLISLCVKCHNLRHGRTPRRFQRKKKLASEERW